MKIYPQNLPPAGMTYDLVEYPENLGITEYGFIAGEEITARIRVYNTEKEVVVSGELEAMAHLTCSRCCEMFNFPLSIAFQEIYIPEENAELEEDLELTKEDIDISFFKDGIIDLGDTIREQLLLALPMKPLCSDDCEGLCPICGKNLNEGPCDCKEEMIDLRLSPLEKLKRKLEGR